MSSLARLFAALSGASAASGGHARGLDIGTAKVVDLTHAIDANAIFWPTDAVSFDLVAEHNGLTEDGYFYAANHFCMPEHAGTHIDAPYHFCAEGDKIGQIPVERLIAPAVVIDVTEAAAADPDYRLGPQDIITWEDRNGPIPAGAIVLLRTGWSSRWPNRLAYLGDDKPGDATNLHFPSYGQEAAQLLVARNVSILGVDTASVDHGPSQDFLVHRVLAEAGAIGLENLTNLDQLPVTGAWVAALPIKLAMGTGAPARVIALVP